MARNTKDIQFEYIPYVLGDAKIYQSPMEYIGKAAEAQAMTAAEYANMADNDLPEFLANIPYLDKEEYDRLTSGYMGEINEIANQFKENPYDKNAQMAMARLSSRLRQDMSPQGKLGLMSANKIGMDTWMANNIDYATTDPETYQNMHDKIRDELLVNTNPNNVVDIISENIVPRPEIYNKEKLDFSGDRMTTETNGFKDPSNSDEARANAIVEDYFNDDNFKTYLAQHNASDIPIIKDGIINDEHPFAEEAKNIKGSLMAMRYDNRGNKYTTRKKGSGNGSFGSEEAISSNKKLFNESTNEYIPNIPFQELYMSRTRTKSGHADYDDISNNAMLNELLNRADITEGQADVFDLITGNRFFEYIYEKEDTDGKVIKEEKKPVLLQGYADDYLTSQFETLGPWLEGRSESNSTPKKVGDRITTLDGRKYTITNIDEANYAGEANGTVKYWYLKDDSGIEYLLTYTTDKTVFGKSRFMSAKILGVKTNDGGYKTIGDMFNSLKKKYSDISDHSGIEKVNVMSWVRTDIEGKNDKFLSDLNSFYRGLITEVKEGKKSNGARKLTNDERPGDLAGKDIGKIKLYNPEKYTNSDDVSKISIGEGNDLVKLYFKSGFAIGLGEEEALRFAKMVQKYNIPMKKYITPGFIKFSSYLNSCQGFNANTIIYLDDTYSELTGLKKHNDIRLKANNGVFVLETRNGENWETKTLNIGDKSASVFDMFTIYDTLLELDKE